MHTGLSTCCIMLGKVSVSCQDLSDHVTPMCVFESCHVILRRSGSSFSRHDTLRCVEYFTLRHAEMRRVLSRYGTPRFVEFCHVRTRQGASFSHVTTRRCASGPVTLLPSRYFKILILIFQIDDIPNVSSMSFNNYDKFD